MSEWRWSAGNFDFCLLFSAVGEGEGRENWYCMADILSIGDRRKLSGVLVRTYTEGQLLYGSCLLLTGN